MILRLTFTSQRFENDSIAKLLITLQGLNNEDFNEIPIDTVSEHTNIPVNDLQTYLDKLKDLQCLQYASKNAVRLTEKGQRSNLPG